MAITILLVLFLAVVLWIRGRWLDQRRFEDGPYDVKWQTDTWVSLLPELRKHGFTEGGIKEVVYLTDGLMIGGGRGARGI